MWTAEEDTQIMAAVATHGLKWQEIAHGLPGRSANAVRNRYLRLHTPTGTVGASGGGVQLAVGVDGRAIPTSLAAAAHAAKKPKRRATPPSARSVTRRRTRRRCRRRRRRRRRSTLRSSPPRSDTPRPACTPRHRRHLAAGSYGDAAAHHLRLRRIHDPAAAYDDGGNGNGIGPDAVAFAAPHIPGAESLAGSVRLQRRLAEPGWHGVRRRERRHRARHRARRAVGVRARRRRRRRRRRHREPRAVAARAGGCAYSACRRLPRRRWLAGRAPPPRS